MLEREDVSLVAIEHQQYQGTPAVKAAWDWDSPSGNQWRITAVLDPQVHWRVLETTWVGNGSRAVRLVDYFDAPGECFPSRITAIGTSTKEMGEDYEKTIVLSGYPAGARWNQIVSHWRRTAWSKPPKAHEFGRVLRRWRQPQVPFNR